MDFQGHLTYKNYPNYSVGMSFVKKDNESLKEEEIQGTPHSSRQDKTATKRGVTQR